MHASIVIVEVARSFNFLHPYPSPLEGHFNVLHTTGLLTILFPGKLLVASSSRPSVSVMTPCDVFWKRKMQVIHGLNPDIGLENQRGSRVPVKMQS